MRGRLGGSAPSESAPHVRVPLTGPAVGPPGTSAAAADPSESSAPRAQTRRSQAAAATQAAEWRGIAEWRRQNGGGSFRCGGVAGPRAARLLLPRSGWQWGISGNGLMEPGRFNAESRPREPAGWPVHSNRRKISLESRQLGTRKRKLARGDVLIRIYAGYWPEVGSSWHAGGSCSGNLLAHFRRGSFRRRLACKEKAKESKL